MKKYFYTFLIFLFVMFFASQNYAQVTNLVVAGASPGGHFTLESGGEMTWLYNVPNPGDTALVKIWIDLNGDKTIDSGDKLWQQLFQIDGDSVGQNGVPDVDGKANGSISLSNFLLGLAPADYILEVTNRGVGQKVAGTITPLTNVGYTISGKVIVPSGVDPANIVVELSRNEQFMPFFWDALTDAQGDYTIKMTTDTAGNPWVLQLTDGQFPGSQITPTNYQVTVNSNKINKDFTVTISDAEIVGIVKREDGTPLAFQGISLTDKNGQNRHNVNSDVNGLFQIGLSSSELTGQTWILQAWMFPNDTTENFLSPRHQFNVINVGDSLYQDLVAYNVDGTITGTVTFATGAPFSDLTINNIPFMQLEAFTDSSFSITYPDTITGKFTLRVSSKLGTYDIFSLNLPPGYNDIHGSGKAGDTGVNINYTLTDVKERKSGIPESFSLSQNYPNPFNPTTNINYDIPNSSFVNITIYNELGQKVISLINKEQKAGKYVVSFDASKLSSGVYFYQLKANDFVQIKKMILLK